MTSEAGGEPARGIGARLRVAREKRGLTVLQAAERLHVDTRTLEALEREDFGALGADVYVRGHLRRYAEAVGESPAELQALYAGSTRAVRPDLTRIPHRDPGRRSARLVLPALLVLVGCALAGLLWWLITLPGENLKPLPVAASLPSESAPGTVPAADEAAQPPATPGSRVPPEVSGSLPAGAVASAQLSMRFAAESWVEVYDAGGRRLLQGLIEGGSTRTASGAPPLRVVLGNAAGVELRFNGRPVPFAGLVRHDGSAHLLIDDAGRVSASTPRLAHGD